jgi:hypothetical protein
MGLLPFGEGKMIAFMLRDDAEGRYTVALTLSVTETDVAVDTYLGRIGVDDGLCRGTVVQLDEGKFLLVRLFYGGTVTARVILKNAAGGIDIGSSLTVTDGAIWGLYSNVSVIPISATSAVILSPSGESSYVSINGTNVSKAEPPTPRGTFAKKAPEKYNAGLAQSSGSEGDVIPVYSVSEEIDGTVETEEKTVTPTKQTQEVTPSDGKYLSKVTVNPIPDDYVIPSGSMTIETNGTHNVGGKAQVVVNVPLDVEYYDGSYEVL